MPGDQFKSNYDETGEYKLSGSLLNRHGRVLNSLASMGRVGGMSSRVGVVSQSMPRSPNRSMGEIFVVNRSSTDLNQFQILQIGDELTHMAIGQNDLEDTLDPTHGIKPFAFDMAFKGHEPAGRVHDIAVLLDPADIDSAAECQIDGVCPALVNVTSKAHRFAKAVAGSHTLQSAMCGHARFVWKPDATGEDVCYIRLGPPHCVLLKAKTPSGGIPAGTYESSVLVEPGSATCDLWGKDFSTGKWQPLYDNGASGDYLEETVLNFAPEAVGGNKLIDIASDDDFQFTNVVDFCVDGFS